MTSYRLKPGEEDFTVVDGEYAGRKYVKGQLYDKRPTHETHRFETVRPAKKTAKAGTGAKGTEEA
jgi:hypothetical protein